MKWMNKAGLAVALLTAGVLGFGLYESHLDCAVPVHHHGQRSIVFETADISDIETYVDDTTLVILDLDNTTFRGTTALGSGDWFYRRVLELIQQGHSKQDALEQVYPDFTRVVNYAPMELCDERLPDLLQGFRNKGAAVIGFTARRPSVAAATLDTLDQLNCSFKENPFQELKFDLLQESKASFSDGIVFAHDFDKKGIVFDRFLKQLGPHPYKRIVFVDDLEHNVQSMEYSVLGQGLEYVGVRYSLIDGRMQQMDPRVADLQLKYLFTVIPDDVAARILATPAGQALLAEWSDPVLDSPRKDDTLVPTKAAGRPNPPPFIEQEVPIEIITSNHIEEVLKHADERTLVVFDLNDTITSANTYLGGDQWAKAVLSGGMNKGLSKEEVHDRLVPFWHEVIQGTTVRPVETNTPLVLRALQQRGCPYLGLTARYVEMAYPTLRHLNSIGVDFSKSLAARNDFTVGVPYPAKFLQGVVFAGLQNDKAEVLIRFLEQQPIEFDKLIFVDDKEKNVKGMIKAAQTLGKPYIGIWYRAVESQTATVDPDIGRIQQVLFHRIMPDSIAHELL